MKRILKKIRVPSPRLFVWVYILNCLSCTQNNHSLSDPIQPLTYHEAIAFENQVIPTKLLTDSELLPIYEVVRRRVELRVGPGLEFPLKGTLLSKKDLVVRIYKYKYWIKVVEIKNGEIGWIHSKTSKPYAGDLREVAVQSDSLQSVFMAKAVNHILDYKSKSPVQVNLKKGQVLKALKNQGAYVLIYIPSNNSVAWIERRHIR